MFCSRPTIVCAFSYTEAFSFSLSIVSSIVFISSDKLPISCSANIRPPRMTAYSAAKPSSSFSFLLIIFEASAAPVIHARASIVEFHSLTSVSFRLKASPSTTATASCSRLVASVVSLNKRLSVSIQSCLSLSFFCASLISFCWRSSSAIRQDRFSISSSDRVCMLSTISFALVHSCFLCSVCSYILAPIFE